jgi:hypothetical protein
MAMVTRTLKKGTDTGRLNRAEVRAVTAAIQAGRTSDVISGAVLKQFRATQNNASSSTFFDDLKIRRDNATITFERSAERALEAGKKVKSGSEALNKTARRKK